MIDRVPDSVVTGKGHWPSTTLLLYSQWGVPSIPANQLITAPDVDRCYMYRGEPAGGSAAEPADGRSNEWIFSLKTVFRQRTLNIICSTLRSLKDVLAFD